MSTTIERARGRWPAILSALGVEEQFLRNKNGPCPMCGGQDRFRFDDQDGSGSWLCAPQTGGCGAGYGITLAMKITGMSMPEVSREIDQMIGSGDMPVTPEKAKRDPRPRLVKLGRRAQRLDGSINPVRSYLKHRGLTPAPATRYVSSEEYYDDGRPIGQYPAMAHMVQDAFGRPATWHLTYLTQAGGKADVPSPRKILTPSRDWKGGAVRLLEPGPDLGIAEGIETAIAAHALTGYPVWSALNAGNLEAFDPPDISEHIHVFGDNDEGFQGQASAYILARTLSLKGYKVTIHIPQAPGTDWADYVGAKACSA